MVSPDFCPKCNDDHIFPCRDKNGWFKCQLCGLLWKPSHKPVVKLLSQRQDELRFLGTLFKMSQRQIYRLWNTVGPIEVTMIGELHDSVIGDIMECYLVFHPPTGLQKLPLIPGTTDVRTKKPFRELKLERRHPYLTTRIQTGDSLQEYFISCWLNTKMAAYLYLTVLRP
jgi:hypothetical protein